MKNVALSLFCVLALSVIAVGTSMGRRAEAKGASGIDRNSARATGEASEQAGNSQAFDIGGKPVVTLVRPRAADQSKPQFLEAVVLPGIGMNVLQLKAFLPGKGEINVITTMPLPEAKKFLETDNDAYGNNSFKIGAVFLLPYPNRIRGILSADGKTVATAIAGKNWKLPANWKGKNPGAEVHAMHGLILTAKFEDVKMQNGATESTVSGVLHGGNFGGFWMSETDVNIRIVLKNDSVDLYVTAKNVGKEDDPMAITYHPYFDFPSGDRKQARLHLPSDMRALVTNYDDVFPTGKVVPVKGTPYDFTAPGGAALGDLFMDDCFLDLKRGANGDAMPIEVTDPAANYGLRITPLSPHIKAIQVYAPPDKNFVAVEPQYNLADPYNKKIWGNRDTGMLSLKPGESTTWHVKLELFTPGK